MMSSSKGATAPSTSAQWFSPVKNVLQNTFAATFLYSIYVYFKLVFTPFVDVINSNFIRSDEKQTGAMEEARENVKLFPKISQNDLLVNQSNNIKSCSTGLNTRLVPVKNEKGEIEWNFTEDSKFYLTKSNLKSNSFTNNTASSVETTPNLSYQVPSDFSGDLELDETSSIEEHKRENDQMISPVTSNSSLNSSPNDQSLMYKPTLPSNAKLSPESIYSNQSKSSGDKAHLCPYCPAEFRIRGYLTRHMKKHAVNKAYTCPFFNMNSAHKCHPNGGFSRRDTYKTHLKSRHFKYPPGTKSNDRASIGGKCGVCNKFFKSNENWVESHIESGECEGLPVGFTGKSRLNLKKKKIAAATAAAARRKGDEEEHDENDSHIQNSINYSQPHQQQFTPPQYSPINSSTTQSTVSSLPKEEEFTSLEYSMNTNLNYPALSYPTLMYPQQNKPDFEDEFTLDTETIQVKYPTNSVIGVPNVSNGQGMNYNYNYPVGNGMLYEYRQNYNNYFTESFGQ